MVAAVTGGLMLAMAYTPVFAASATDTSATTQSAMGATFRPFTGRLFEPGAGQRGTPSSAEGLQPDSLYSQHSVVGDPQACFVSRFDARAGAINQRVAGIP